MWIVFDHCDGEFDGDGCGESCTGTGRTNLMLFDSEQTAQQEADLRSKRYGGSRGRPDRHIDKISISTKVSGY